MLCILQVFFCKYNDPLYVKMEKLEIMIKLANERNIDQASMSVAVCCKLSRPSHACKLCGNCTDGCW